MPPLQSFVSAFKNQRTLLLLTLTVLAGFTIWLQWYNRSSPPAIEPTPSGPDYYLRNFTLTATGADGLPRYIIDSAYMEYIAGQETITFLRPSLFFDNENQTSWQIQGDKARVTEQGRWIMMEGQVVLKQRNEMRNETIRLETADLLVLPEQKRAESNNPVLLTTSDAIVKAVGLRMNLLQERFELLHQVQGEYRVPPS